jgi:chemotaxis signal transduction protein
MAEDSRQVRGLLIPVQGGSLALPDSIIVQILTGSDIVSLDNAPGWLLGTTVWQKRVIPVLSFELASSHQYSPMENPRLLVMKSLDNIEKMPFYAFTIAGIPSPVRFSNENMTAVENASAASPVILNQVLVDGEPAIIPNADALEEMLISQYGLFVEETPAA